MAKLGFAQALGEGLPELGIWQAEGEEDTASYSREPALTCLQACALNVGWKQWAWAGWWWYCLSIMAPARSYKVTHTLCDAPRPGQVPFLLVVFGYGVNAKPATGMFMVKPPRSGLSFVLWAIWVQQSGTLHRECLFIIRAAG